MTINEPTFENEKSLRQALSDGSKDPRVYCGLADVAFRKGRTEEARSLYEQALQLPLSDEGKGRIYVEFGWLHYETGDDSAALHLASSATDILSQQLDAPEVLAWQGAALSLRAHCIMRIDTEAGTAAAQSALQLFKKVILDTPEFNDIAEVYLNAARVSNLLWHANEAVLFSETALRYNLSKESRSLCLLILAEAFRHKGDYDKAENTLEDAFRMTEGSRVVLPRLYMELGMVHRLKSQPDEAERYFKQALNALKSHPYSQHDPYFLTEAYANLGEIYYELAKYDQALSVFEKLIGCHSDDNADRRNALFWLGQCYHAVKNFRKARECYEVALTSPFCSAVEKISFQAGLGKLYYDEGDFEDAITMFLTVIGQSSDDNEFYDNILLWLGCSYEAVSANADARDCFEKVLMSPKAAAEDKNSARDGLTRLGLATN